jgi:hypothetical protein
LLLCAFSDVAYLVCVFGCQMVGFFEWFRLYPIGCPRSIQNFWLYLTIRGFFSLGPPSPFSHKFRLVPQDTFVWFRKLKKVIINKKFKNSFRNLRPKNFHGL